MNIKQILEKYIARGTTDATTNTYMRDVIGAKGDAAAATGTTKSLVAYAKQSLAHHLTTHSYVRKCVVKSDGALLAGVVDDIFTIAGGPVYARIFGIVTTLIVGATNGTLKILPTTPNSLLSLSTTVALDDDAAGTLYSFNTVAAGTVPVLTPTTGGALWFNEATATFNPASFFLPPGTVQFLSSAARVGVIAWYMEYIPLHPSAVVTAAA
jgi:hypothetical protein